MLTKVTIRDTMVLERGQGNRRKNGSQPTERERGPVKAQREAEQDGKKNKTQNQT